MVVVVMPRRLDDIFATMRAMMTMIANDTVDDDDEDEDHGMRKMMKMS